MTEQKPEQKKFLAPENALVAILQYLNTRPYGEVSGLIQAIQRFETFETDAKEEKKPARRQAKSEK